MNSLIDPATDQVSWIALALLLPAAGAILVAVTGRWPNVRDAVTTVVCVATFGAVLQLLPALRDGVLTGLHVIEVLPGLDVAFAVESLGMIFALVASGLWIVTSVYAFGYMRGHHEENQTRFFVCFAIAIFAALGISFADNLFTLFLFYEILTFSTYPLVTHHGTDEARRAGRVYLGVLVTTSVGFLLLAIVWTGQLAGTLDFRVGGILSGKASPAVLTVLLALYAFGIGKAALMPFHRWLPAAMVAPTPVSALLHAVAVVKAGVFSVMKVLVYVFGADLLADLSTDFWHGTGWLVAVSSFTILTASIVAMKQDNLKRRLAYSTISQLSYIVLAAALFNRLAVTGGSLHIVTHAVGKITLFFCAGAIYVAVHKTEISDMRGLGRRMPFTMFAFLIGSLSIIGLPPFAGAWSKWYLFQAAIDAGLLWVVVVLMVSSLLNIAYLMPVAINAFFLPIPEGDETGFHEAPVLCVVPLMLTAFGCFALFLWPDLFNQLAEQVGTILEAPRG